MIISSLLRSFFCPSEAWLALLLALLALGSTLFALDTELEAGLAHWVALAILLDALFTLVVGANSARVGLNGENGMTLMEDGPKISSSFFTHCSSHNPPPSSHHLVLPLILPSLPPPLHLLFPFS